MCYYIIIETILCIISNDEPSIVLTKIFSYFDGISTFSAIEVKRVEFKKRKNVDRISSYSDRMSKTNRKPQH